MTTKHNNTTNGEIIVERILTSDAFLTKEIKKDPSQIEKTDHSQPTSNTYPTTSKSSSKVPASII